MNEEKESNLLLVPLWWWKAATADEELDYQAELLSCLDSSLGGKSVALKPFTLGSLALIELIDSQCWHNPERASVMSWARLYWIVNNRKDALPAVLEFINAGKVDSKDFDLKLQLDKSAAEFLEKNTDLFSDFEKILLDFKTQQEISVAGFRMIPGSGGTALPYSGYLFGSTFIVPHATRASILLNETYENCLWNIPMSIIAHATAIDWMRNDVKGRGLSRPKNQVSTKEIMSQCEERAAKGELQPWQIEKPHQYKPTREQIEKRPEIIAEFEKLTGVKVNG